MSSNAQKTPFARQLHQFGDDKSTDWLQRDQKRMPATLTAVNGPIVTAKLDGKWDPFTIPNITIPKAESLWVREPSQVGDRGFITVSDFYLGGQSGLGGGTADLYPRANLTGAVFQPVSSKTWSAVNDPNQLNLQGPTGVRSQTQDGNNYVDVKSGKILIADSNGNTIVEQLVNDVAIYIKPKQGYNVYLGGDGVTGTYDWVLTASGPSINVKARVS